ncbi:MAG: Gfo/Idh/MocA family oxidoreductase [Anaerolineae bacterium]|nr:Gfo/Idh/MocA family oxidoreductase [Anaerolineae bacterium]
MNEVRFGLLGAGMIAGYHAAAIRQTPGAKLVAVARDNPARRAEAEAAFGVPCFAPGDLLARDDVDAVVVCTPSGQHSREVIAAARHGKHALVEKPMALSLAEADQAIQACQTAGVHLGVVLQRRADPVFQGIKAALDGGDLGIPTLALVTIPYWRDMAYYHSARWRGTWALDGGGALMNQGVHLVDLLVWWMGDPVSVQAQAATLVHDIEVEDVVSATLKFVGGAQGVLAATTAAAPGFPHRLEVYGTRGGVQVEGEAIFRWGRLGEPMQQAASAADAGAAAKPTGIKIDNHQRIIADFVAAVRDGRPPMVTGQEGRRALATVLAVYAAAGLLPRGVEDDRPGRDLGAV